MNNPKDKLELFASPDTWLLNLGYVSENAEQNLILYGYLSARGVLNVELLLDAATLVVRYVVVLNSRSYFMYKLQKRLELGGLFSKFMLLMFLRTCGSYDAAVRINRCVADYTAKRWKAQVEVVSVKQYNKIIGRSGAKGWFFQARTSEDRDVREGERSSAATSASSGEVVRDFS